MAVENICPHCGKPVPPTALQGICPECMLKAGFQTEAGQTGPHGTKIISPPPRPEEIAPLFPQLEILESLGRGGMGAVYKARQPKLNRFVALKILARDKENDPKFAERFEREAQALARLNHPNIVTVYDFGEVGGHCYLLMEYVDGLSLRQLLQTGKMKPEQALAIVPKICEALQFAHEHGIVHRDIKPENILLDKQGRVKIADFGIAKMVGGETERTNLTGEKGVIGTPHYMAPEQIEKPQEVDHRADIYSLGVVFYEMLTGELPLGKFAPPSRKVQVDVRLDEIVLHALEKEPELRYQHASEVKTDVETIFATGPQGSVTGFGKKHSAMAVISRVRTTMLTMATFCFAIAAIISFITFGLDGWRSPRQQAVIVWFNVLAAIGFAVARYRHQCATQARENGGMKARTVLAGASFLLPPIAFAWFLLAGHQQFGMSLDPDVLFWFGLLGFPASVSIGALVTATLLIQWKARENVSESARWSLLAIGAVALLVLTLPLGGAAGALSLLLQDETHWTPSKGEALLSFLCFLGVGLLGPATTLLGAAAFNRISKASGQLRGRWGALAASWFWPCIAIAVFIVLAFNGFSLGNASALAKRRESLARQLEAAVQADKERLLQHQRQKINASSAAATNVLPDAAIVLFNEIEDFGQEFDAAFAATNLPAAQTEIRRLQGLLMEFNASVRGTSCEFPATIFPALQRIQDALEAGDWARAKAAADTRDFAGDFQRIGDKMAETARERHIALGSLAKSQVSSSAVPPVVVSTVPESGASDVDPALSELRVTFSKPMRDGNWSWVDLSDGSFPRKTGPPKFLKDGRTCVLPVKLEPNRTYATWINVDDFQNFQDRDGRPAVPYLLIFKTRR